MSAFGQAKRCSFGGIFQPWLSFFYTAMDPLLCFSFYLCNSYLIVLECITVAIE